MAVTVVIGRRQALAGMFLLLLSALAFGSVVAPSVSQAVTTYTRSASCAGLDFYPTDSRTEYDNAGPVRFQRDGDNPGGTGVFRCDPGLPNGAVVTKVQFTVRLVFTSFYATGVGDCSLRRSGLTVTTASTAQDLAHVAFYNYATSTGAYRLTDSTISNATVDNANFGYWLECYLSSAYQWGPLADTPSGLYGADVIYTITAAKG
jgi:hypothetical protein